MFDPNEILLDPKYRKEQLLLEAAWRFQLVAPLVQPNVSQQDKRRYRQKLLSEKQNHPFRGAIRVSGRSLRRWCQAYRAECLAGLSTSQRRDAGVCRSIPAGALEEAKRLFCEDRRRSVAALIRLLGAKNKSWASIKRTTLGRHLRAAGLRRGARQETGYLSFEAREPNALWQGDVLHGPKVTAGERVVTAKVVCWIDDHSRRVMHVEAFDNERLPVLEHTLTQAVLKHGKPRAVLVDNGKIYSSTTFTLACSELGIHKIHSSAYHPESKGKQERFFRTLREQLLNEVENLPVVTLERLNGLMRAWLTRYHQTEHSKTGQTPDERYKNHHGISASPEQLERAFLQWAKRTVSAQGIICFAGQQYHVDPTLAGQMIVLRYNPFDLSSIWLWKGGFVAQATAETLLHATLSRKPRKQENAPSSAAELYLESLENSHRHQLEQELNLLRLEDCGDE